MTTLDKVVSWLRFRYDASRWYRALLLIANGHDNPQELARKVIQKP
jgi:hypothetical protein